MVTKRDLAFGFVTGLAGLAAASVPGRASDGAAFTEADAMDAIMTWLGALQTGDPANVEKILAPEFQILRSDGSGHGKSTYLKALPKQTGKPAISELVVTGQGEVLVTRYIIEIAQTIDGKPVQAISPRLSVFRHTGSGWLIVAHANFARIG